MVRVRAGKYELWEAFGAQFFVRAREYTEVTVQYSDECNKSSRTFYFICFDVKKCVRLDLRRIFFFVNVWNSFRCQWLFDFWKLLKYINQPTNFKINWIIISLESYNIYLQFQFAEIVTSMKSRPSYFKLKLNFLTSYTSNCYCVSKGKESFYLLFITTTALLTLIYVFGIHNIGNP